jgi:starch synthase (maltosyl-transferring)
MKSSTAKQAGASRLSELELPSRVVIEGVYPEVDGGRFQIKRVTGQPVFVVIDAHADGHNVVACAVLFRKSGAANWSEHRLLPAVEPDRFAGQFDVVELGHYEYTFRGWIDKFANWRRDTSRKLAAGREIDLEILEGSDLLEKAQAKAKGEAKEEISRFLNMLKSGVLSPLLNDQRIEQLMFEYAPRGEVQEFAKVLGITVEPHYALFSTWYELFPRSVFTGKDSKHGTLKDVIHVLPYVRGMGFDVLYLPPIHPIGVTHRKGPNNTLLASENDPGSPWAIGSEAGGHMSVHPELGTIADFDKLSEEARKREILIALDLALQCSPDHPWVKEHPDWFYRRPDNSIKYGENPPKKYDDIYPIAFDCADWRNLWSALKDVVLFWVEHGVKIFRVDNPHTKPYHFWEYLIGEVKRTDPGVIFLAEAFARPKVMKYLAKVGFSQSYTYFTWRNSKRELEDYLMELTRTEVSEYLRPNFFVNTPDILSEYLQVGGKPAFMIRLVLAATLSGSYGIYGPPFELCVANAMPGTEEYRNSEKYEVRKWNLESENSISHFITRVNRIRRDSSALQFNHNLQFLEVENESIIAYARQSPYNDELLIIVVNCDPNYTQAGFLNIPLEQFGLENRYQVHDLLTERKYQWYGPRNYIELNPHVSPAFIFRVRQRLRTEHNFDYFM